MEDIIIKCVGKKIIVTNDIIRIHKTIGRDVEISISDIEDCTFTKGTLKENGILILKGKNIDGLQVNESLMFWYSQNNIVENVVNSIINYSVVETEDYIEGVNKVSLLEQIKIEGNFKYEEKLKERENLEPKKSRRQEDKERLEQLKRDKVAYCPKCKSTSITTTNKKLSLGRALVGGVLLNGTGAILGGLTSKKILKVCLNCGHRWK